MGQFGFGVGGWVGWEKPRNKRKGKGDLPTWVG